MDILKALPSRDVSDHVLKNGYVFTDMQKTVIIYHSILPLQERIKMLGRLEAETTDPTLKKQLSAYLAYIKKAAELFKSNADKKFVYKTIFMEEYYDEKTEFSDVYENYCDSYFTEYGDAFKSTLGTNHWEAAFVESANIMRVKDSLDWLSCHINAYIDSVHK